MGLDTSHDAWHGAYSSFHRWRIWLANEIGINLEAMEGFSGSLKWEILKPRPIYTLLSHSDCDGYINWSACGKIAKELKEILSTLTDDGTPYNMFQKTQQFMEGCELAFKNKEKLDFH